MKGKFHTGDFDVSCKCWILNESSRFYYQGTSRVGLVYIYQLEDGGTKKIQFVQFTSDGTTLTPLAVQDGPSGDVNFDKLGVVVGDLDGNG
jgi:hypothetical protein